MVGRIELVLLGAILLFLFLAFGVEGPEHSSLTRATGHKQMELILPHLREVNATSLLHDVQAQKAEEIDGIWYFRMLELTGAQVRLLRADRGSRSRERILLEGNVTLVKPDDSTYRVSKAVYRIDERTLDSVGPFEARRDTDRFWGYDMHYDMRRRIVTARKVHGVYRLVDTAIPGRGEEAAPGSGERNTL